MKSKYFIEYFCSFSSKSYYFYILGVSHLKFNLTLKVKVNRPQSNTDLSQVVLHLWSKFGDPSFNRWWVFAWTSLGLTYWHLRTYGHTDAGNDNTQMPKLASGKNGNTLYRERHTLKLHKMPKFAGMVLISHDYFTPCERPPHRWSFHTASTSIQAWHISNNLIWSVVCCVWVLSGEVTVMNVC